MIYIKVNTRGSGALTPDARQRIHSALETELRRGIRVRHPFFDNLIRETAQAAAKAVAARSQQHLHLHQTRRLFL